MEVEREVRPRRWSVDREDLGVVGRSNTIISNAGGSIERKLERK